MAAIRWVTILGFVTFAIGLAVLVYGSSDRLGFSLSFIGFSLAFLGMIAGNWIISRDVDPAGLGKAYRVAIVGFCIAVSGILLQEVVAEIGTAIMAIGLVVMFGGFFVAAQKLGRADKSE